jgi:ribosome biogenesis GTPase / thiamine phosphate phosphatase
VRFAEAPREEKTVQALNNLGWSSFFEEQVTEEERGRWLPGRVVWEGRQGYRVSTGDTEWEGRLAGRVRHAAASRADRPVVGDWVLAELRPADRLATIHRLLARRSCFARAAAGRATEEQIVAANVDTVMLVSSFNNDFNLRRIERYLALAWESGARPIVVLNKADLSADHDTWRAEMESVAQGVPVIVSSAQRGDGMAQLHEIVRTGGTTAFLGSSGVGKSTLINALLGESRQDVLPIRSADDRGRHSTTARQLFCLRGGGVLLDTPGMRELQLLNAEAGLERAFADIYMLAASCRFRDCSHGGEPGCAVAAAVERNELTLDRLDSYRRLIREDAFLRSRHDGRARSQQTREAKRISRAVRLQYKLRRR